MISHLDFMLGDFPRHPDWAAGPSGALYTMREQSVYRLWIEGERVCLYRHRPDLDQTRKAIAWDLLFDRTFSLPEAAEDAFQRLKTDWTTMELDPRPPAVTTEL